MSLTPGSHSSWALQMPDTPFDRLCSARIRDVKLDTCLEGEVEAAENSIAIDRWQEVSWQVLFWEERVIHF
jgi:hypothetical protein